MNRKVSLDLRLCVLAEPPEAGEAIRLYFREVDRVSVLLVPAAPLPRAEWSIVPAGRLADLAARNPYISRQTRLIAFGPPRFVTTAFMLGCWDFLKDPWSPEELYLRLLRLGVSGRKGEPPSGEAGGEQGGYQYNRRMLWSSRHAVELRPAEHRILDMLVQHAEEVVDRPALETALWDQPRAGSRSLDMHISNLRRKLRYVSSPDQGPRIEAVRGQGYRLLGWPERGERLLDTETSMNGPVAGAGL